MQRPVLAVSFVALGLAAVAAVAACGSDDSHATSSAGGGGAGAGGPGGTASGPSGGGGQGAGTGGAGAGGGMSCDPEDYLPAWATNAVPDLEVYVAPNGDDANDGSMAHPLATTAAALAKIGPGVRLNFRAGTYGCNLVMNDLWATRDKPAIVRSFDGPGKAVFACSPSDAGVYVSRGSAIVIDGIELSGSGGHGIQVDSGSPFDPNMLSHDFVVHASFIHDVACAPIKVAQSKSFWVIGNRFARPGTCGAGGTALRQDVEFVAVDDTVIVGNDATESQLFDEVKGGAHRSLIALNHVHDGTDGILVGGDGTGFQFLVDPTVDFEAEQVIVWGNTIALPAGGNEAFRVVACHDCLIANNTFWAPQPIAILRILTSDFGDGNGPRHNENVRVVNNVFAMGSKASLYAIASDEMPDVYVPSHNLWFAADGSLAQTGADIPFLGEPTSLYDVDPLLVGPPADLHPKGGSPVLGAGVSLPEVPGNGDGLCWSGKPDIGAY